jgi:hypothetical protein
MIKRLLKIMIILLIFPNISCLSYVIKNKMKQLQVIDHIYIDNNIKNNDFAIYNYKQNNVNMLIKFQYKDSDENFKFLNLSVSLTNENNNPIKSFFDKCRYELQLNGIDVVNAYFIDEDETKYPLQIIKSSKTLPDDYNIIFDKTMIDLFIKNNTNKNIVYDDDYEINTPAGIFNTNLLCLNKFSDENKSIILYISKEAKFLIVKGAILSNQQFNDFIKLTKEKKVEYNQVQYIELIAQS